MKSLVAEQDPKSAKNQQQGGKKDYVVELANINGVNEKGWLLSIT